MRPPGGQRGSGTVLVAGVLCVVLALTSGVALLAGFVMASHAARGTADLAALSAAAQVARGKDACAAARAVAIDNGATLTSCRVRGDSLNFAVSVGVRRQYRTWWPGLSFEVGGTAHAGVLEAGS